MIGRCRSKRILVHDLKEQLKSMKKLTRLLYLQKRERIQKAADMVERKAATFLS